MGLGNIGPYAAMPVMEGKAKKVFLTENPDVLSVSYFAVLTNMKSVGVMGDGRTYDWAIALRSVTTEDFMTLLVSRLQLWNSSKEGK